MNALKVIIYFSIFKYPLNKEEIFSFSSNNSIQDIENELNNLLEKDIIYKHGDYYNCTNNEEHVTRRLNGNKMANAIMPKALKKAKLIMSFPYVESVLISGSLAKGYHDNNCDVDFFVITKPQKLWIARTLLILYKKVFLLNSKKYFCINYFISSNNYLIDEKNIFTAIELSTLIPVYGKDTFNQFIIENPWVYDLLPNKKNDYSLLKSTYKKSFFGLLIESLFNNKLGISIDSFFKAITVKKWNSKFKHLNKADFEIAMKSTNDVSKHHPQNFQSKVITALNEQYELKNKAFNLNLTMENA